MPKYARDSAEWVWLAGFLSGRGSISPTTSRGKYAYVRLTVRAPIDDDALHHAARIMDCTVIDEGSTKGRGAIIIVQGEPLNDIMKRVWPWLGFKRRAQYKRALSIAQDRVGYMPRKLYEWLEAGPEDEILLEPRSGDDARAAGRARWRAERKAAQSTADEGRTTPEVKPREEVVRTRPKVIEVRY